MINGVTTLSYSAEMDFALLWVTATVLGHRTTYFRLTLAAIVGILPTLWVLLRQNLYSVPWELGLVWPLGMLVIALGGLSKRFWVKGYLLFVSMSLLAGGMLSAALSWQRLFSPNTPYLDWAILVPPLLVVMGRLVPKERLRQLVGRDSYGELQLELNGTSLRVPCLWDSGNELVEQSARRPVIVLEMASAIDWIPEALFPWIISVHEGNALVAPPETWACKVSMVTFRTIAGEGCLPVVLLDRVRGNYAGRWYNSMPMAVGFSPDPIARDGSYRALATPKSLIHYPNERVGA